MRRSRTHQNWDVLPPFPVFYLWHPPPSIKLPVNKSLGQNAFITSDPHGGDRTSREIVNQIGLGNSSFANANWHESIVLASGLPFVGWVRALSLWHFREHCIVHSCHFSWDKIQNAFPVGKPLLCILLSPQPHLGPLHNVISHTLHPILYTRHRSFSWFLMVPPCIMAVTYLRALVSALQLTFFSW